jgi:metallo-beta-lactamase family protein
MNGATEVRIYGEPFEVRCKIGSIKSMSAHGDYEDLMQFLACQNPEAVKQVYIVHGEPTVQDHFAERLKKKGFKDVIVPELHATYELK